MVSKSSLKNQSPNNYETVRWKELSLLYLKDTEKKTLKMVPRGITKIILVRNKDILQQHMQTMGAHNRPILGVMAHTPQFRQT